MEDDTLELCGYYNDMDGVDEYFKQVQKHIDHSQQTELEGDYLVIPTLYYKLKRTVNQ